MSEYDDDEPELEDDVQPEPAEGETPAGTVTATVTREEIVRIVAERFYHQLNGHYGDKTIAKAAKATLKKVIAEQADTEIKRIVGESMASVARELVDKGWPTTDQYGNARGTMTVREIVIGYLTYRDNYGQRFTRIEEWAKGIVDEAIKKEVAPLIEEAKQYVRKILDENVAGAIKRALLEGAGLRT